VKWVELSVEAHPEAVDAIAEVFIQSGTGGVAIDQSIAADDEGEEPARFLDLPLIKAYLPITSDLDRKEQEIRERLWHLQAFNLSPVGELMRQVVQDEDWANAWKEHFHPLQVGRVVVKPSWRGWEVQGDEIVVELDPGMAFGTGIHPTTQLTLAALQGRAKHGVRVLDLGTGSGILAIASAKLGAEVTALDISEVAVDVARQNVWINGLAESITVSSGSIEVVASQRFDLILANIIASVLIDLAESLRAALQPEGELLASGIIEERADLVREAFVRAGLMLTEQKRDGDWWLIAARRPA
jgi:ribosomal protein L11 methyltransferase